MLLKTIRLIYVHHTCDLENLILVTNINRMLVTFITSVLCY